MSSRQWLRRSHAGTSHTRPASHHLVARISHHWCCCVNNAIQLVRNAETDARELRDSKIKDVTDYVYWKNFDTARAQIMAVPAPTDLEFELMLCQLEQELCRAYDRRLATGRSRGKSVTHAKRRDGGRSLASSRRRGMEVAHSDDFREVRWHGVQYRFTPTQAQCVKVLWNNWERGTPEVGDATVLELADSNSGRLDHVFRSAGQRFHEAWGDHDCSRRY